MTKCLAVKKTIEKAGDNSAVRELVLAEAIVVIEPGRVHIRSRLNIAHLVQLARDPSVPLKQ